MWSLHCCTSDHQTVPKLCGKPARMTLQPVLEGNLRFSPSQDHSVMTLYRIA